MDAQKLWSQSKGIDIGLGNGLEPSSSKSVPELMLTMIIDAQLHHQRAMS